MEGGGVIVDVVQQLGRPHAGGPGQHRDAHTRTRLHAGDPAGGLRRGFLSGFHRGLRAGGRRFGGRLGGVRRRGLAGGEGKQQGQGQQKGLEFHVSHGSVPFLWGRTGMPARNG